MHNSQFFCPLLQGQLKEMGRIKKSQDGGYTFMLNPLALFISVDTTDIKQKWRNHNHQLNFSFLIPLHPMDTPALLKITSWIFTAVIKKTDRINNLRLF